MIERMETPETAKTTTLCCGSSSAEVKLGQEVFPPVGQSCLEVKIQRQPGYRVKYKVKLASLEAVSQLDTSDPWCQDHIG